MAAAGGASAKKRKRPLLLTEWQLLYTYSSFYQGRVRNLDRLAHALVSWGVAECAITSEGSTFWNNDDPGIRMPHSDRRARAVGADQLRARHSIDRRRMRLEMPSECPPYALQAMYEWLWSCQSRGLQLGDSAILPPHVTAHLGPVTFYSDLKSHPSITAYPTVKVYATGIVVVSFRTFSPEKPTSIKQFVDKHLQAPFHGFESMAIPPGVAAWWMLATSEEGELSLRHRVALLRAHRRIERMLASQSKPIVMGDFGFRQVEVSQARQAIAEEIFEGNMEAIEAEVLQAMRDAALQTTSDLASTGAARSAGSHRAELRRSMRQAAEAEADRLLQELEPVIASAVSGQGETMHGLALLIMCVVGLVESNGSVAPPVSARKAFSSWSRRNPLGGHWTGRTHSVFFRFSKQATNRTGNEARYSADWHAVLNKTIDPAVLSSLPPLPTSSRRIDDFGIYQDATGTLWVHSRASRSLMRSQEGNRNREKLIHEHLVTIDLNEYGYALHRKVAAALEDPDPTALLVAQSELATFDLQAIGPARYQELSDRLAQGREAYGLPRLTAAVSEALRSRHEMVANSQSMASHRWMMFVVLATCALALPGFVEAVAKPVWEAIDLPRPERPALYDLMLVSLTALLFLTVLWAGYRWSQRALGYKRIF